jgi:hypothetical protein
VSFKPAYGAHYYLVAAHSGKVLEVKGASNGNGAIIQTADPKPFKSSDYQQWAFNRNADRIWVLRSRGSQKIIGRTIGASAPVATRTRRTMR